MIDDDELTDDLDLIDEGSEVVGGAGPPSPTIGINSNDPDETNVSTSSLTFTDDNWQNTQNFKVEGRP